METKVGGLEVSTREIGEAASIRLFIEVLPNSPGGIRLMLKRLDDEATTEKKSNLGADNPIIVSRGQAGLSID